MDPIRILMVTGSLRIGGMESVAMNIARYSDHQKFKIDFLVYGNETYVHEAEVKSLGGHVFRVPFPHNSPLMFVHNVRRVIRDNGGYSIVHCHELFNCGFVAKAAYLEKVPVRISHSHTNRLKESDSLIRRCYEKYMRKLMLKYSTEVYACSQKAGEYLFGHIFKEKGVVLNNGIYLPKYQFNQSDRDDMRRKLGLEGKKVIGQVGTLNDVKNHVFSLRIFKQVHDREPNAKLIFVGEGAMRATIENEIKKLELENDVLLLGERNDVPELLGMMDVYIMPSLYEGVSVALVEAQAAGLPCVVSDTACAPEVRVTEQIISLSLDSEDEVWVDKILMALQHPRATNSGECIKKHAFSVADSILKLNCDYEKYVREGSRIYE